MKLSPIFAAICVATLLNAEEGFDQKVMEAILNNPEVVLLAIQKLEDERHADETVAKAALIAELEADLFQGNETIRLVEFFDYRCSYCARSAAFMATLPTGLSEGVRYIEFPILGDASTELAKLSIAVRNTLGTDAYQTFHREVFASEGRVSEKNTALRLIERLGWDVALVSTEAESEAVSTEILRNKRLASRLGINGTPTFVGRDQIYGGVLNPEELVKILAAEEAIDP